MDIVGGQTIYTQIDSRQMDIRTYMKGGRTSTQKDRQVHLQTDRLTDRYWGGQTDIHREANRR
jgi:hypothetical protein